MFGSPRTSLDHLLRVKTVRNMIVVQNLDPDDVYNKTVMCGGTHRHVITQTCSATVGPYYMITVENSVNNVRNKKKTSGYPPDERV